MFAFLSVPINTVCASCGSLADNQLCGLYIVNKGRHNESVEGTYTAEGITKLCDGLKGSAITSLKCAST